MRGQIVQFERLDMGQCTGGFEAGYSGDSSVRTNVNDHLGARQHSGTAIVQLYFDRAGRYKTSATHDQFGAAGLVGIEVEGYLAFDHRLLALAHLRHIDANRSGYRTIFPGLPRSMGDVGTP